MSTIAFAGADKPLRVAFFHTELSRDGPGLLLRDILRGKDPQVDAVVQVIAQAKPDVIALWGIDWDLEGHALGALADRLAQTGHPMQHRFARRPNRAEPTGLDLDGDGRLHEPEDAHGYGRFTGENGLAILSRFPMAGTGTRDFGHLLWSDLPEAQMPWPGAPVGVEQVLRMSSTSHLLVPVQTLDHGTLWLGTFAAQTPVFDGPEDRNGRRNADELRFWVHLLDGRLPVDVPMPNGFVLAGHANLDPVRGEGQHDAIREVLDHSALQDPAPQARGDTATVDWQREDLEPMRLSYVLPDHTWEIVNSGVVWPDTGTNALAVAETASRHRLVWVDLLRR